MCDDLPYKCICSKCETKRLPYPDKLKKLCDDFKSLCNEFKYCLDINNDDKNSSVKIVNFILEQDDITILENESIKNNIINLNSKQSPIIENDIFNYSLINENMIFNNDIIKSLFKEIGHMYQNHYIVDKKQQYIILLIYIIKIKKLKNELTNKNISKYIKNIEKISLYISHSNQFTMDLLYVYLLKN